MIRAKLNRAGKCIVCGMMAEERRGGICYFCCHPKETRELRRIGVPWGTCQGLRTIMKKCRAQGRSDSDTVKMLSFVHPRIMENVRLDGDTLLPVDKRYFWKRRTGWMEDTK